MSYKFLVLLLFTTGVIVVGENNQNWTFYSSLVLMAGIMYAITYYGDAKNPHRPEWQYRLSSIAGAAYVAHFLYPQVQNIKIIYLDIKPFATEQLFIAFVSYFAVTLFKQLNGIKTLGWRVYLGKLADYLKAKSEEK